MSTSFMLLFMSTFFFWVSIKLIITGLNTKPFKQGFPSSFQVSPMRQQSYNQIVSSQQALNHAAKAIAVLKKY